MTMPQELPDAFTDALHRLASPAPEQVDYLQSIGLSNLDELALEFDDLWRPIVKDLELISKEAAASCREIDSLLSESSLGWTFGDAASDEWQRVRNVAKEALRALLDRR